MTLTQNADSQAAFTPDSALERLLEGNRRFVEGAHEDRDLRVQVQATAGGQWPYAVVLGCMDSRVSPELVFDAGVGDLFAVRVAGNLIDEDVLGSMEYGCKFAGSKLIVVLGHSHCGAVKGACDDVRAGNLTALLAKLRPAVEAADGPADPAERTSSNAAFVQAVVERNVRDVVDGIRNRSEILRDLELDGSIRIVGACYDVETGRVGLLD
jgi:carbonic anhydrase